MDTTDSTAIINLEFEKVVTDDPKDVEGVTFNNDKLEFEQVTIKTLRYAYIPPQHVDTSVF